MQESKPVGDLLPGISDHIVLDKIVDKLLWQHFYILSSVSRAWYKAIRSHEVFNSRILSRSSETLIGCCTSKDISIYSLEGNLWCKLPPIPDISRGQNRIPERGQCISMDGKIYVVGGVLDSEVSRKVFVFDLAGLGRWEQCASMNQRRERFASAVKDGQIYVFGGNAHARWYLHPRIGLLSDSEVYEPKEDTWSPIKSMNTCQIVPKFHQHAFQIGEELFIYGGCTYQFDWSYGIVESLDLLEAYHPVKDEWRVVHSSFTADKFGFIRVFTIHRNFFSLRHHPYWLAIHEYDVHGNTWVHVHSFSHAALIPVEYFSLGIDTILVVDDELLVLVRCGKKGGQTRLLCLFQSTGFGSESQEISWNLRATTTCGKEQLEVDDVPNIAVYNLPELEDTPDCFIQQL